MTYDKSHRALGAESGRRQESLIPTSVFFAVCQCRLYPLTYSSICPHVHLSAHPPTDPLTQPAIRHLPAHPPTHLPTLIYPFFHRPTHPSTHSSICLHIHLPTYTSMSPFPFSSSHLSVHLPPIHLLVLPSIHPLTHQSCIHSLINSPTLLSSNVTITTLNLLKKFTTTIIPDTYYYFLLSYFLYLMHAKMKPKSLNSMKFLSTYPVCNTTHTLCHLMHTTFLRDLKVSI